MTGPAACRNNLAMVAEVACLLAGGWAEELSGLRAPGRHRDIDLVHLGGSFAAADRAFRHGILPDEIAVKRFPHKRAFAWRGVCCEMLLIEDADTRPVTWFWGDIPLYWQVPVTHGCPVIQADHAFEVLSTSNLRLHRTRHRETQPWRWRTYRAHRPGVGSKADDR